MFLETHHLCKRKNLTTRWDYRNGFPVCCDSRDNKESCHQVAHTKEGENIIRQKIGDKLYFELDRLARMTINDYIFTHNLTRNEFKEKKKGELNEIIRMDKHSA
jgi:hypothetical protein